jgi:hypothetical protein
VAAGTAGRSRCWTSLCLWRQTGRSDFANPSCTTPCEVVLLAHAETVWHDVGHATARAFNARAPCHGPRTVLCVVDLSCRAKVMAGGSIRGVRHRFWVPHRRQLGAVQPLSLGLASEARERFHSSGGVDSGPTRFCRRADRRCGLHAPSKRGYGTRNRENGSGCGATATSRDRAKRLVCDPLQTRRDA